MRTTTTTEPHPRMPAQEKGRWQDLSKGHHIYNFDVIAYEILTSYLCPKVIDNAKTSLVNRISNKIA